MRIHLHPTAPLAERVLLPGDPGRALVLAQLLLEEPKMFNHNRGLWGYTGQASDGELLTVQATGIGGPSAAIVLHELVELGARRAIRVGTCGGLLDSLALGDLVIAREALCADGTSRALGADARAAADARLCEALVAAAAADGGGDGRAPPAGTVVSVDLFYDEGSPAPDHDAIAVEMEAATLFTLGSALGIAVACVLCVSDTFGAGGERVRVDARTLEASVKRMGRLAVAALSV